MSLIWAASSLLMTRSQLGRYFAMVLPLESTIESIGRGLQYMPPEAGTAYAAAMSSGLTLVTPSVNDGTWLLTRLLKGTLMPIDSAARTVLQRPAFFSSCAK